MKTEKNYRTVPNQKTIANNVKTKGRYYQVDEATFTLGCTELKPTTFLVWQALHLQYFTEQKLALSTSVISKLMGDLRLPTVQSAIKELIEKGWMAEVSPNCYELVNPVQRKALDDNHVQRKALYENDDVQRKALDACNEKRYTGVTESVGEIRIKEEEDKKNTSRTETVEKEEEAPTNANASAASINEVNGDTFNYDTAKAQGNIKEYYKAVADAFDYAADMKIYVLDKEDGKAYSTKPFANGSGYRVYTVGKMIDMTDGAGWCGITGNTSRDSYNNLLDNYEYKRAACYYFLSKNLK